jgi:hypothetical protein
MGKPITKDMAIKHYIGHFCCEEVPDEWDTMTGDEQETWLHDNAWKPFENEAGSKIYAMIECMADSMLNFLNINDVEVDLQLGID